MRRNPLGSTTSICPHCKATLPAELVERNGRVVLSRRCPDHGSIEAVVYGDAERYLEIQRFDKPGIEPLERQTEAVDGCPHDCGICPEHAQHTCLGIIEVNTACNLDCPICFADSGTGPQEHGFSLSLEQVESMLDAFVRAEGEPESVQLSGGEPSIHPQILGMLSAARERGIDLVMLNTNGIRLARDRGFAPALAEIGVHVYLQFDGFDGATQMAIRGRDLTAEKLRALDRCAGAGVSVSLAAAIERGVNEHEVGGILRFGIEHPAVNGVFFQPVTHSGRFRADTDPLDKLTNSDVIDAIADQLPDWFAIDDFVAVPCCSPSCRSATFALYDGEDVIPLPRLVDVEDYLDYVTNRAVPDLEVREALEGLWSAKAAGGSDPVAQRLDCVACATGMPPGLREVAARGFMVVVQDFQDLYTLDVEKLRKCCVSEITPDGRLIPFCAYNSVGYREQVRAETSRAAADGRASRRVATPHRVETSGAGRR
ncbi:MAG TPA: radical SAM protein [Solirubrobacterales bacterium]|nr:radical SAM protein [Solirubrobacterales bacterium]